MRKHSQQRQPEKLPPYLRKKSRQELKHRPQKNAAYWLALYGLLNLLSFTTQDYMSGVTLPTVDWALP